MQSCQCPCLDVFLDDVWMPNWSYMQLFVDILILKNSKSCLWVAYSVWKLLQPRCCCGAAQPGSRLQNDSQFISLFMHLLYCSCRDLRKHLFGRYKRGQKAEPAAAERRSRRSRSPVPEPTREGSAERRARIAEWSKKRREQGAAS